jgi:hypothetical protein
VKEPKVAQKPQQEKSPTKVTVHDPTPEISLSQLASLPIDNKASYLASKIFYAEDEDHQIEVC